MTLMGLCIRSYGGRERAFHIQDSQWLRYGVVDLAVNSRTKSRPVNKGDETPDVALPRGE